MSLYFFHLWSGAELERDEVGLDLADATEAYLQAFRAAQGIWIEALNARSDPRRFRFEVTNEVGQLLFELPFMEIITARAQPPTPIGQSTQGDRSAALVGEVNRQVARAADALRTSTALMSQLEAITKSYR